MTKLFYFFRMHFLQNPPPQYQPSVPAPPVTPVQIPALPSQGKLPAPTVVTAPVAPVSVTARPPAVFNPQKHVQSIDDVNKAALQMAMYKAMMDQEKPSTPQGPTMADISNFMLSQGSSVC